MRAFNISKTENAASRKRRARSVRFSRRICKTDTLQDLLLYHIAHREATVKERID